MKTLQIVAVLLFIACAGLAAFPPRLQAEEPEARVQLRAEKCRLNLVSNLPYRATWQEQGKKTLEGCWGRSQRAPVFVAYFEDRTVYVIPMVEVRPVWGT